MKRLFMILLLGFILLWGVPLPIASAQEETCPTIVHTAIDAAGIACQEMGRNQLCYGNSQIEYTPREGVTGLAFAAVGDILDVTDLHSLRLYPLDVENEAWGVALMKIQANLPGTMPGQNVTFVLFGDAVIENAGSTEQPEPLPTVEITANNVNLRTGPSTDYGVYTNFSGPITVDGRNEAGDWVRMRAPGSADYVWAAVSVISVDGDVMTLPVVEADAAGDVSIMIATNGEIEVFDNPFGSVRGSMSGEFAADGRSDDGVWLRTFWGGDSGPVWFRAADVTPDGDIFTLAVIDSASAYGPMQAFYFRTGVGDARCEEAPDSGILVQTPKGMGEVTLNVNGIDFALGSTALFQDTTVMGEDAPGFNVTLFDGMAHYADTKLFPGMQQTFVQQGDGAYMPFGNPVNADAAQFNAVPLDLLPDPVTIPQRGVLNSNGYDVVYNYFLPGMDVPPNGCAVVALHGARLSNQSWNWMVDPLVSSGWGVWAPDMPGHGQSGGPDDWSLWGGVVNDGVTHLQDTYGYGCGLFIGSSIGANNAAWGCAQWPEWCVGAVLFSPGTNYHGNDASSWLAGLGDTPVYIVTSTNDRAGGNAQVAERIAGAGGNTTVQVYDSDLHGTDIAADFPVWQDMAEWWQQSVTP